MELIDLTEQLTKFTLLISRRYIEVKEIQKSGDFYSEVKPFADEVKLINDQWKRKAIDWIIKHRPKNIFVQQIEATHENIETISIQSFYRETSKTRFTNLLVSSQYVLNRLHQIVNKEIGPPAS